jgi:hypothetical protein
MLNINEYGITPNENTLIAKEAWGNSKPSSAILSVKHV